ncbi:hypothetical protein JYT13_00025 [Mariprofundus ferrooxydans]|nr:hypothetical protein [Mariprofundus ferrooxydans]
MSQNHQNAKPGIGRYKLAYAYQNTNAAKSGGQIASKAKKELEGKTSKSVVTDDNYLPPLKKTLLD